MVLQRACGKGIVAPGNNVERENMVRGRRRIEGLDIAPFALPNGERNELRLEETRDIQRVVVTYVDRVPARISLSYLQKTWPQFRYELMENIDMLKPSLFGWSRIDDQFNAEWRRAAIRTRRSGRRVEITFRGLAAEKGVLTEDDDYDVTFRRTLGIRIGADPSAIASVKVFTRSAPVCSSLRVELDSGRKTPGDTISFSGYNVIVRQVRPQPGGKAEGDTVRFGKRGARSVVLDLDHMTPAFRYANDDGHVKIGLGTRSFTVSLTSLEREGPIWFAERGVFITWAHDATTFAEYRARTRNERTVAEQVRDHAEHSLGGALLGQPRQHAQPFVFGHKHCREMFFLEPSGDLLMPGWPLRDVPGRDRPRFRNRSSGRFFFGLENWITEGWFHDPFPMLAQNLVKRNGPIRLDFKAFAVPLMHDLQEGDPEPDAVLVAMLRFRFHNDGSSSCRAELPVSYMDHSGKGPRTCGDPLSITGRAGWIRTRLRRRQDIRAYCQTTMRGSAKRRDRLCFSQVLAPGDTCELILKVPYIAIDTAAERARLKALDFGASYDAVKAAWAREPLGAAINTPEPRLNELHKGHVPIVYMSDFEMTDGSGLVNTSVGAACYLNYPNESCMILQDLDERGLHDAVRRRLGVWLKYQGTEALMGNFSDHDGVFYGAGGVEQGNSYNQHHGWVLWALAEHYFLTRDRHWFSRIADQLIQGMEWVFRQRRATQGALPYSRGWERGFLPAGALEDVDDYFYWLSTNCLTWRGVDTAARALADIGRPESQRLRAEADAFGRDLKRGFDTARDHSPLVRLRNGRWAPHYPSRLYLRGRDYGWIREVLEGSVYLLISGLYDHDQTEAGWILDDFQDTRYMNPPFGLPVVHQAPVPPGFFAELPDPVGEWFCQGGFSVQPNLLAGLLPHLDRDEPEIFLWMFFNAWTSCYGEDVGSLVEMPIPALGFSNIAPAKTSDESNATKWLRYMFVYAPRDELHIGRAIPRAWLGAGKPIGLEGAATRFGPVSVHYRPGPRAGTFVAELALELRRRPARTIVRFRTPNGAPLKSVKVNGKQHKGFDATKGDVDISNLRGRIRVEVRT